MCSYTEEGEEEEEFNSYLLTFYRPVGAGIA